MDYIMKKRVMLPHGDGVAVPYYNIGFNVGPDGRAVPGDPIGYRIGPDGRPVHADIGFVVLPK